MLLRRRCVAARATAIRGRDHRLTRPSLGVAAGAVLLCLVFACEDGGSVFSPTEETLVEVLSPNFVLLENPSYSQQEYEQQVAASVAPVLMFDQDQGYSSTHCFPQDAGPYWDQRRDGYEGRMCSRWGTGAENAVTWGWAVPSDPFPTYFIYGLKSEEIQVLSVNEVDGTQCAPLLAGRNREVGTLCAEASPTTTDRYTGLRFTLTADPDWEMTEAYLWVGEGLAEMPQTKTGNPKVGHFPYRAREAGGFTSFSFDVPVSPSATLGTHVLQLAAHAVVREANSSAGGREEGAWAEGARMVEKGNWATYSTVEFAVSRTEYVMYWWFYAYQDECSAGSGAHDADWERVNVKVVDGQLDRVMFFQHGGWYTRKPFGYTAWRFELQSDGTYLGFKRESLDEPGEFHPFVYVGKNQHGAYHDGGGTGSCFYFEDWRDPGSWVDSRKGLTWLNLVPLNDDEGSPEWMKKAMHWGGCCWITKGGGYGYTDAWAPLYQEFSGDPTDIWGCAGCTGSPACKVAGCYKSQVEYTEKM